MTCTHGSGIAASRTTHGLVQDLFCSSHGTQWVYPDLADAITVTSDAAAWTLGAAAEIVPANTITNPYMIHFVSVSDASAIDEYQLELYYDGQAIKCTFVKSATADPIFPMPVISPIIPANTQITAKLANKTDATSRTVNVKIWYNEH